MKVLHLASFRGNVGDQLNHHGFRPWFESLAERPIEWVELEIREVYRGERNLFEWIQQARTRADLLVIGGGNFWETWPENSRTGNSVDLTIGEIQQIEIPIFFNSVGLDTAQGISESARDTGKYIDRLHELRQTFVTLRNDGARHNLATKFKTKQEPMELPDHGFFALKGIAEGAMRGENLILNLASDMPQIRFAEVSRESQFRAIAELLEIAIPTYANDAHFAPHVHGDLESVSALSTFVGDKFVREKLSISRTSTAETGLPSLFSEYSRASFVIANRFHSIVASLALGKKVMPIANYPQISLLLEGLPEPWPFPILSPENFDAWRELFHTFLETPSSAYEDYSRRLMVALSKQRFEVGKKLYQWLETSELT